MVSLIGGCLPFKHNNRGVSSTMRAFAGTLCSGTYLNSKCVKPQYDKHPRALASLDSPQGCQVSMFKWALLSVTSHINCIVAH